MAVFQLGEMYSFLCVGCRLFMLKRFVSGSTQLGIPVWLMKIRMCDMRVLIASHGHNGYLLLGLLVPKKRAKVLAAGMI